MGTQLSGLVARYATLKTWLKRKPRRVFKLAEAGPRPTIKAWRVYMRQAELARPKPGEPETCLFDDCAGVSVRPDNYHSGRDWWPSDAPTTMPVRVWDGDKPLWSGKVLMCPRHFAAYHKLVGELPPWNGPTRPKEGQRLALADALGSYQGQVKCLPAGPWLKSLAMGGKVSPRAGNSGKRWRAPTTGGIGEYVPRESSSGKVGRPESSHVGGSGERKPIK